MCEWVKHSITRKFNLINILSISLPLFVTLFLVYLIHYNTQLTSAVNFSWQHVSLVNEYLKNAFDGISNTLTVLSEQNELLVKGEQDGLSTAEKAELRIALQNYCYINSQIANAYLCFDASQEILSAYTETGGRIKFSDVAGTNWYREVRTSYDPLLLPYPYGASNALAYVQVMRDPATLRYLGFVMVKLNASYFRSVLRLSEFALGGLFLLDGSGTIYTSSTTMPEDFSGFAPILSEFSDHGLPEVGDYLVCEERIGNSNLFIAALFSRSIIHLFGLFDYLGLIAAVVFLAMNIVASSIIIRRLIRPINRLAWEMEHSDLENLQLIELTGRSDEVGILERKYNEMVERFYTLIETEYRATLRAREAQLRAMQWQINPHFVNNTLQTIGTIALTSGRDDIYNLVHSFSSLFYYSLRYKGDIVTLSDELNYLADYLNIQRARFPDRFDVVYDIELETKSLPAPKMVLQPLVENTFSHSFIGKKDRWRVRIEAHIKRDGYRIEVIDNGVGMEPEKLKNLQNRLQENDGEDPFQSQANIGLKNVHARIRLLYGEPYGVTIESNPGQGARVMLTLPGGAPNDKSVDR